MNPSPRALSGQDLHAALDPHALAKITHLQVGSGPDAQWRTANPLSTDQLDMLIDLLERALAIVDAHPLAFRRHQLYLGDFWYDALESAGRAGRGLAAHPDREQLHRTVRALVRALSHTHQPADITKRAESALLSVLNAAWDNQIDALAVQTAVALDAAAADPADADLADRVRSLAALRHLMPGDRLG